MIIRILVGLLGASYVGNGLWTVAMPESWYFGLPGVSATGPMNVHFIEDIGFAALASGILLMLGGRAGCAQLAAAGALWPALHALIHIAGWSHQGFPTDIGIIATEVIGVVALSGAGIVLAWLRLRQEGGGRGAALARA